MAVNTGTMIGNAGRRKGPSSPTTSTLPLAPTTSYTSKNKQPSSSRNTSKQRESRSHTTSSATSPRLLAQGKPRKAASNQRTPISIDDSDSDLTPQSSDNDDENDTTMQVDITPRRGKKHDATPKSADKKGKGKEKQHDAVQTKEKKNPTTTGPNGRVRKRAIKLEDAERRRARDEKFNMGASLATASSQILPTRRDLDETSSFGDDESDHGNTTHAQTSGGFADRDDMMTGLPDALAGQDIEDLAYGAGSTEFDMDRNVWGNGWWSSSEDEEEEDGIYIDHLSGSEAERQSVSTSNDNQSDVMMSDSDDFSSSSEDEQVDEFGFPLHSVAPLDPMGPPDRPLILMENWKGELELVQPRQERSRSRRGDRGSASRTAGSIGDSTVVSGDQDLLRIDPDEDASDASSWSGLSDEEDEGGDTTDSMAEEDMPMLDSPALQQLIGERIGHLDVNSIPSPCEPLGPSIVVTDTSMPPLLPETPALSTTSSTPNVPIPVPVSPSTPGANGMQPMPAPQSAAAAPQPQMGTFHPATDDPAQCAVIDGSKTATKSPFTHKRRDPRQRKNSIASSRAASLPERKRKSSMDIFSPSSVVASPKITKLPKKARYSSIPGHPRYVRARRAAEAEDGERESTPSDSETADQDMILSLEDMIETSVLVHENANDNDHLSHLIRFDRVPVSTYLRRNIMSSAGRVDRTLTYDDSFVDPSAHGFSSPVGRGYGMTDTLAGPVNGRGMLVSPVLAPVGEADEDHAASRKERRKMKRRGMPPPLQL